MNLRRVIKSVVALMHLGKRRYARTISYKKKDNNEEKSKSLRKRIKNSSTSQ